MTTSELKSTLGIPGSRACETWRQAAENRSCQVRRCSREAGGSPWGCGSISATTTTTGRPIVQPNADTCSSTYDSSPAPRTSRSRRKSPWYLFSTADTALCRVMSRAATIATRSRACTSSSLIGPSSRTQTSRARSVPPAATRSARTSPTPRDSPPSVTRSTRIRPVTSTSRASASPARASSLSADARSRPSVEVSSTPDPQDVGRLRGDLPEVTALEDQVGQRRVQRVHPGERKGRVVADGHAPLLAVNT